MLGFIKKDLKMIKSNYKLLIFLMIIYVIMAYQGALDLTFLLPFLSVMLMISTFSYDNYNKWDAYAVTLPNGRKNSVKAKYLATILLIILVSILIVVLSFIISYTKTKTIDCEATLVPILINIIATVFIELSTYPLIYKFGVEKARVGIIVIVFAVAIIGGILVKFLDFTKLLTILSFMKNYWLLISIPITALLLYLSYKISVKIYLKKEF